MSKFNSQRDAVFAVVTAVKGEITGKVELNKDEKELIHDLLVKEFQAGNVPYAGGIPAEDKLRKYVPGLVNNWCRKDKRLNGNVDYIPKNPGSRSGSGDEMLKNMKNLLEATTDPDARKLIQAEIDARKESLKPKVVIDVEKLPEHLRAFVPPTIIKQ